MKPQGRPFEQIAEDLRRLQHSAYDGRDRLSLLHEISVYQEELLAQTEALVQAQSALEETRDRFIELYDFAPISYLTLDGRGIVRLCNLTASALFGRAKHDLEGFPMHGFVAAPHRPRFTDFLRRCRAGDGSPVEGEFTINTANGAREVQLVCRPRTDADSSPREYFVSLVDVTDRRRLEREREKAAREHAALASRLISIQEDERKRIARNLHDDIGQQVTALRLKLDAGMADADEDRLQQVARLQTMVETLDRRLHFVATELRPATLDLGLVTALEQFVGEWSSTFDVPAQFASTGLDGARLPPEIETHLYRIAQEALNNVLKHAAARHVAVLLERRSDGVVLIVEDDGRGFDASAGRDQGIGLVNMRERAQIIGGRLEIETSPGHGTTLFLTLPC